MAWAIVAAFEAVGHDCWIAPRNVTPGKMYSGEIVPGIRNCDVLVLVLTQGASRSADVTQEVQIAHSQGKLIVPVVVNNAVPSDDIGYFIGIRHQIAWESSAKTSTKILGVLPPALREQVAAKVAEADMMEVPVQGGACHVPWPNAWHPKGKTPIHHYSAAHLEGMGSNELIQFMAVAAAYSAATDYNALQDRVDVLRIDAAEVLRRKISRGL